MAIYVCFWLIAALYIWYSVSFLCLGHPSVTWPMVGWITSANYQTWWKLFYMICRPKRCWVTKSIRLEWGRESSGHEAWCWYLRVYAENFWCPQSVLTKGVQGNWFFFLCFLLLWLRVHADIAVTLVPFLLSSFLVLHRYERKLRSQNISEEKWLEKAF